MRHCLKLSSIICLLWLAACSSPYKSLQFTSTQTDAVDRFRPMFQKKLYRCVVDGRFLFKKFHLSGALFFKRMEDRSTRVVFQNEMGFAFFDFGWTRQDSFSVNQIIPQLNKPAVIKTLRKDLALIMMRELDRSTTVSATKDGDTYYRFTLPKGFAYYREHSRVIDKIETVGKHKPVTTITMNGIHTITSLPDSVYIVHHKAHFTIQLTKLDAHVDE